MTAFSSDNMLDTGTWTLGGSPDKENDLHNTNAAIICDGATNYAERTSGAVFTSGAAMWGGCYFKFSSSASQQGVLFAQYVGSGQRQYMVRMETNGRIDIILVDTDNVKLTEYTTTSAIWNDDAWHHMAFSRPAAGGMNLVVDGVSITSFSIAVDTFTTMGTTGAPLRCGMRGDGNNDLLGSVARVRVENVEKSVVELQAIYTAENAAVNTDLSFGLTRLYTCDDNAASTVVIDTGDDATNLTLNGGDNTSAKTTTGQVDEALTLNGTDDQIKGTIPSEIDAGLTKDFTIGLGFNLVSTPVAQDTIFGAVLDASNGLQIEVNAGATAFTMKAEQGGTAKGKQIASAVLTTDLWQHIIVTWTAATGTFKTYYNGAAETDTAQTGGVNADASACLVIGSRCNDARYVNEKADDTWFINRVLTTDEITEAYGLFEAGISINGTLPGGGLVPRILTTLFS